MHDLVENFPPNARLAFNREELRVGGVDQHVGSHLPHHHHQVGAVDGDAGTRGLVGSIAELTCIEGHEFNSLPEPENSTLPPPTLRPHPAPYDTGGVSF